jgi:hypothetical protein
MYDFHIFVTFELGDLLDKIAFNNNFAISS